MHLFCCQLIEHGAQFASASGNSSSNRFFLGMKSASLLEEAREQGKVRTAEKRASQKVVVLIRGRRAARLAHESEILSAHALLTLSTGHGQVCQHVGVAHNVGVGVAVMVDRLQKGRDGQRGEAITQEAPTTSWRRLSASPVPTYLDSRCSCWLFIAIVGPTSS